MIYEWEHIVYIIVTIGMMVLGVWLIHRFAKKEKTQKIILIVTSLVLLINIILNRIAIVIRYNNFWQLIPTSLCGLTSLLFPISIFIFIKFLNHVVFHWYVYSALIGGMIAIFYPNFLGQDNPYGSGIPSSFWYFPSITGLLHHTISIFLVVLLISFFNFRSKLKYWYANPIGYIIYIVFGLFTIQVTNLNDSMNIYEPIVPGLTWYLLLAIITIISFFIILFYEKIVQKKIKKYRTKT